MRANSKLTGFFIVLLSLQLGACKTLKTKNRSSVKANKMINLYNEHLFDKKTVQAKVKTRFESPKMTQNDTNIAEIR